MPLLIAALLGFSAYQWVQSGRLEEQRDASAQRAAEAKQDNQRLQSALDWQRSQSIALGLALSARDEQIERITTESQSRMQQLSRLERDDAEISDWSSTPLPAGIANWVRGIGADDSDDHTVTDSAGEPDDSPAVTPR